MSILPPEKEKPLYDLIDRFREDVFKDKDASFLVVVKIKGYDSIVLETGGDDAEKEQLMAFFLAWCLKRSAETLGVKNG